MIRTTNSVATTKITKALLLEKALFNLLLLIFLRYSSNERFLGMNRFKMVFVQAHYAENEFNK